VNDDFKRQADQIAHDIVVGANRSLDAASLVVQTNMQDAYAAGVEAGRRQIDTARAMEVLLRLLTHDRQAAFNEGAASAIDSFAHVALLASEGLSPESSDQVRLLEILRGLTRMTVGRSMRIVDPDACVGILGVHLASKEELAAFERVTDIYLSRHKRPDPDLRKP
jgi:hypothetical protein